ncbi:hypothetical protein ACRBEV_04960 [Methylobacterium phyllosphaerae]
MTAVAFDTLKFARALRDKAKLSPEQAEGFADALVDVLDGNLAAKGDIRDVRTGLQGVRSDVEALRIQTRGDIEALKAEMIKWMFGTVGLQTIVILGAVITLVRSLH